MSYTLSLKRTESRPREKRTEREKVELRRQFMAMIDLCEERLLWSARRLHRNNEDAAQELVQEGIVRAYEAFLNGGYDERKQPLSWLIRIQTNLFVSEYRRWQKWSADITVDDLTRNGEIGPASMQSAPADRPGVSLMRNTLDESIETALNQLSEEMRLVVVLVDVEDFSYVEAAETLQITVGMVRARLYRARQTLQDLLRTHAKARGWL